MGQPVVDNIINMEKVEPGILSELIEKLSRFDQRYTDKVRQQYGGAGKDPFAEATRGTYIKDILNPQEMVADSQVEQLAARAIQGGVLAANVGSRYALPAGAAMLAAQGVSDLSQGLYDTASGIPIL